jgi:hypothetical protein
MQERLAQFLDREMRKHGRLVPARLQTALALLERLREAPSLDLKDHKRPGSSGLLGHEGFGQAAHERLGLTVLSRTHGRRSNEIDTWGQGLLRELRDLGFEQASPERREAMLQEAQTSIGEMLSRLSQQAPLVANLANLRSVEDLIADLLAQADAKKKAGDVAQYLVGAKLQLRLNREIPVFPANKADRRSYQDLTPRLGDFCIGNAIIEVALGPPDDKHLEQMAAALAGSACEVWILTRAARVGLWNQRVRTLGAGERARVVISSVEGFIGQNLTEMGSFVPGTKSSELKRLFGLYNSTWVAQVGTPEMRIHIIEA